MRPVVIVLGSLALLPLVACGGEEAGILLVPAGNYHVGNSIVAGKVEPPAGNATVEVQHVGDRIQFTMTGTLATDYSCQPRVWIVRLNASGDATSVERTQENCTQSISKAAYESLGRNYRLVSAGFVERITDGNTQIECYYDKK